MRGKRWLFSDRNLLCNSPFLDVACYVSDFIAIMLSYIIAVVLRYKVMESDPGINALSWPYLITVMIYSFVMASVLKIMGGVNDTGSIEKKYRYRTDYSSYLSVIISQLIGCLGLLSFFYVANAIYFSRIALVLFWLISSGLLIAENMLIRKFVWNSRKVASGSKVNVLVVGTGKAAMEYIRSVICFPNYGYHLIGYLADEGKCNELVKHDFLNQLDDFIISSCGILGGECGFNKFDNIPSSRVHCCGEYKDFESVVNGADCRSGENKALIGEKIDDIIFCTDDMDDENLKQMLTISKQHNMNAFFASKQNEFLPASSNIFEVGGVKLLNLKARKDEKNIFILGLIISIAMLLLFMLMKDLNISTSSGFNRFVSYKGLIFAISSIFLYGLVSYVNGMESTVYGMGSTVNKGDFVTAKTATTSKSNIFSALLTIVAELIAIGCYECAFYRGKIPVGVIKSDVIMMLAAVVVMFVLNQIVTLIGRDDIGLMF